MGHSENIQQCFQSRVVARTVHISPPTPVQLRHSDSEEETIVLPSRNIMKPELLARLTFHFWAISIVTIADNTR